MDELSEKMQNLERNIVSDVNKAGLPAGIVLVTLQNLLYQIQIQMMNPEVKENGNSESNN